MGFSEENPFWIVSLRIFFPSFMLKMKYFLKDLREEKRETVNMQRFVYHFVIK